VLKPLLVSVGFVIVAVLLNASPVARALSEESSRDAVRATGDAWGSVEPLLEYRPLPVIEWVSVLGDGSIGDVWLQREDGERRVVRESDQKGIDCCNSK
jgi:hypothetical protein